VKELIWANLKARPIRTGLSVLAVALQVFLLLFLMGLTDGIVSEWGERVKGIGADLLVQSPNASIFIAISSPVLPQEMAAEIAGVEGVTDVAPVLTVVSGESLTMVYGIDYDSFNRLGSGFLYHQGGPFAGRNDVIVDDIKATSKDLKVGDPVELLGESFRVAGIVEHGRGARYFIPLATAQELMGAEQRVSMFWVQSNGNPRPVYERLTQLFPRHRIRLMDEYLSLMVSSNLPGSAPSRAPWFWWESYQLHGSAVEHVHHRTGADARDRYPESAGRVALEHCRYGAARIAGGFLPRHCVGRGGKLWREVRCYYLAPDSASAYQSRMAASGIRFRHRRLHSRLGLSRAARRRCRPRLRPHPRIGRFAR
jgi:hypothetical protein